MRRHLPSLLVLAGWLVTGVAGQQVPGGPPRMTLFDGGAQMVPGPGGPFDNSGVFDAVAGQPFQVQLSYLAQGQPNENVPWGILLSAHQTPFPTDVIPPPLFTQPPFFFILPNPITLDASGQGMRNIGVPPGLIEGTVFLQAIVRDGTSAPALKLSNGVAVQLVPPGFNVRFSFARAVPAQGILELNGVGTRDIDGATLKTFPPLGAGTPPDTTPAPIGLPDDFAFLPIVPHRSEGPVNVLARPVTTVSQAFDAVTDVIPVADTRFFPPRGQLLIAHANTAPWANKTGGGNNLPAVEVVRYAGKTATSFTGAQRQRLGSTGSPTYPHLTGEIVLGEFTFASSAGALGRAEVGVDARNPHMPHLVLPPFTFDGGPDVGPVSRELDLYLYEETVSRRQGFLVLDRMAHAWELLPGTSIDTTDGRSWNPVIAVSPDHSFFLAAVRTVTGPFFGSDPDQLFAIRLDGRPWPATQSPIWPLTFTPGPEPDMAATEVPSRRVVMTSIAIMGQDADNFVAFVGLAYKFRQTNQGNTNLPSLGHEGEYVREDVLVKELFEVPLVPPGSNKAPPAFPRPFITSAFGLTGTGAPIIRFDPVPLIDRARNRLFVTGGGNANIEDIFLVRNVGISQGGMVTRQILNLSGQGAAGGVGAPTGKIRPFGLGSGHGLGPRAAFSPGGTRVAWLGESEETRRDWIRIARTSGLDFGSVRNVYENAVFEFREPGPYVLDRAVTGLHFVDEDNLVFLMGLQFYSDPLGTGVATVSMDLFRYTISTDTMVNLTNTGGSADGFGALGKIVPAATLRSDDGRYLYLLRTGPIASGNTTLPANTPVTNVLAVDLQTWSLFDVTGDELGPSALITNLHVPTGELRAPVEAPVNMGFVEGHGAQDGLVYVTAHRAGDASQTDELFAFNRNQPFVGFQVTTSPLPGVHVTNVTPNPFSGSVAFARTADANALSNTQHPFVVDLDNFLFERDLVPSFSMGGVPFGRVMDGSFHFVAPSGGVPDALVFVMGSGTIATSGVAQQTEALYYPLANLSDLVVEPEALLLPILSTLGLGVNSRLYLGSAGPSTSE